MIARSIQGLGITSVKHRCPGYRPAFEPGDPIKALTWSWFHNDDDPPAQCWFPGHFIRLSGQRAIVRVPAKALALDADGVEFEPNGNGYLKLPLARVAHRDGERADVTPCSWCGGIVALGDPCGRDPNYTPAGKCALESVFSTVAVEKLEAAAREATAQGVKLTRDRP